MKTNANFAAAFVYLTDVGLTNLTSWQSMSAFGTLFIIQSLLKFRKELSIGFANKVETEWLQENSA